MATSNRQRRDRKSRNRPGDYGQGFESFYETIREAVRFTATYGYESEQALNIWLDRIKRAAVGSLTPIDVVEKHLRSTLRAVYDRNVQDRGLLRRHRGVSAFTIDKVKPELRAELDRRIAASANLIKLNRQQAIDKTLQRFAGWATSVPAGGSNVVEKQEEVTRLRKEMAKLNYEERRVAIDQGHKLAATINDVIAVGGGAIAAVWHSKFRQPGYDARPDHKERDSSVYAIRGCWALEKGLMKPGASGYTDQITQPAEEPFCRCSYQYLYALRDLPKDMLTEKGKSALTPKLA